eukprot:m.1624021 g.1624021  ORF g.1624021 m.1624021 type:complete len:1659 (-) comp25387_c0_seq5:5707-10683(-)
MTSTITLNRALQRRCFDWISSRSGIGVCFFGFLLMFTASLHYGEKLIDWRQQKLIIKHVPLLNDSNEYYDNIAGRSFAERMCLPLPIDIVYTWVNGSDPRLMADLAEVKYQLELEHNLTEKAKQTQLLLEKFRNQTLAERGMAMSSTDVEHETSTTVQTSTSTTTTVTTTTSSNVTEPRNGTFGDDGNASDANITTGAGPSLIAPDVKTLILSSSVKMHVWGDSEQRMIHDHVRQACGSVKGVQLDSEGYSALAVFEHEENARACMSKTQLDVDPLNATFAIGPVSYCGGHTLHGLFPLRLSPAIDHFNDTEVDDPIGFAAYSELVVMLSGIPATMETDAVQSLAELFGTCTVVHRAIDDGIAVVEYNQRMSAIKALEHARVGVTQRESDAPQQRWTYTDIEDNELKVALEHEERPGDVDWNTMYTDDGYMRSEKLDEAYGAQRGFSDDWYGPYPAHTSEGGQGMGDTHHGRKLLAVKHAQTRKHAKGGVHNAHHPRSPVPPKSTVRHHWTHAQPHPRVPSSTHVASDVPAPHLRGTTGDKRARTVATTPSATTTTVMTSTTMTSATTHTHTRTSTTATSITTTEAVRNWTVAFWAVSRVGAVKNVSALDIPNRTTTGDGHSGAGGKGSTGADEEDEEQDEIASSRFQDNSELQYSLRSIEKYAPWVRHIYLVTNGQIPSWLDLDHPRISVVTHHDIFSNTSHLPVFSSPAIEAHLHEIPGLSDKFIYLNDDVMFGMEVWPDDFYTHSRGQNVFEAWPVPNCVEGCPSNWISDSYCDQACNNAECDWDGGDCIGKNSGSNNDRYGGSSAYNAHGPHCATGCTDSWLADKFCDRGCDNVECGYDMGDCGMDKVLTGLDQFYVYENATNITHCDMPSAFKSPRAFFVNLTLAMGDNISIVDGEHDGPDVLVQTVLSQEHKMLMVVLRDNVSATTVNVTISATQRVPVLPEVSEPEEEIEYYDDENTTVAVDANHSVEAYNSTDVANTTTTVMTSTTTTHVQKYEEQAITFTFELFVCTDIIDQVQINATANATNTSLGLLNGTAVRDRTTAAIAVVNDSTIINYWQVDNATNATIPPTKTPWLVPPNASQLKLKNETMEALNMLELDYKSGILTEKGLAKYKYYLLLPYLQPNTTAASHAQLSDTESVATEVWSTMHGVTHHRTVGAQVGRTTTLTTASELGAGTRRRGSATSRHLQAVRLEEESEDDTVVGVMHAPFVTRNGVQVPREEAETADWIEDQKRKVYSYDEDMRLSIRSWEQHTGKKWRNMSISDRERSPLPWERLGLFDGLLDESEDHTLSGLFDGNGGGPLDDTDGSNSWRSRHTLDTFGDSLKKVNRLYNKHFGYRQRRVIAHMPHFIDRNIMLDLVNQFPDKWEATSSHRLRSGDDMQYAFAYYHFLIEQTKNFSVDEAFTEYDLDENGVLSVHELRTLITRLYDLPTSAANWESFENMLLNCSIGQEMHEEVGVGIGPDAKEVWVTRDFIKNCTDMISALKKAKGKQYVHKSQLISEQDGANYIAFEMVRNNLSIVMDQLDAIRRSPRKFVCLNDNIDHRKSEAQEIVGALHSFYESFFPKRSQFELPIGLRNRFLHMDDLRAWQSKQTKVVHASRSWLGVLAVVFVAIVYCRVVRRIRRCWIRLQRKRLPGSPAVRVPKRPEEKYL